MKKNRIYLVGNAHLDPVWQWQWQEGSAEAKATIRSALDRMKEFPEFRFVCSSASVYQWVEEFAPEMFEEIRQRVKEGRFIIVGGHHVQPDCNLLSGEAYARQALYAQRYFYENFGVTAKSGYNVDSFGHNLMMPQILKKSGMDTYVFLRPAPEEKEMERDLFHWVSPDGSSVLTYRILDPYCFKFNSLEEVQQRIDYLAEKNVADTDAIPFFYGVGNHGGPRSEESDYTDQGLFEFQYALMPVSDSWAPIIQEAKLLNKPVTHIIENWHNGYLMDKTYQGLHISTDNVMLAAIKRSEDGKGLVVRIYETDGKETPVQISGGLLPVALDVTVTPWSANTYYLADGADTWKEVLFTEFDA